MANRRRDFRSFCGATERIRNVLKCGRGWAGQVWSYLVAITLTWQATRPASKPSRDTATPSLRRPKTKKGMSRGNRQREGKDANFHGGIGSGNGNGNGFGFGFPKDIQRMQLPRGRLLSAERVLQVPGHAGVSPDHVIRVLAKRKIKEIQEQQPHVAVANSPLIVLTLFAMLVRHFLAK
ncbi:hypothetical protein ACLKA6_006773 [Drosophila palustris]